MARYKIRRRGDRSLRVRICRSQSAQTAFPMANRSEWILGVHQLAHHINDPLPSDHTHLERPLSVPIATALNRLPRTHVRHTSLHLQVAAAIAKPRPTHSGNNRTSRKATWLELQRRGEWFLSEQAMSGRCPCPRTQEIRITRRP